MKKLLFATVFLLLATVTARAQCGSGSRLILIPNIAPDGGLTTSCYPASGSGSGTVTSVTIAGTSNQITASGTCTITATGTCTLSLPAAIQLGTDNSAAGTVQLSNGSANAHTIWGSGATTTNTINGFAAVPTTGHLIDCTVSTTVCLMHDSGVVTANVVNASSPGIGLAHFAGSTQTVTSSAVVSGDLNITTTSCTAPQVVTAISAGGVGTCTAPGGSGSFSPSPAATNNTILIGTGPGTYGFSNTLPPFSVGAGPSCPTGVVICFSESTSPSGAAAGVDVLTADSVNHSFLSSLNGGSFNCIPQLPGTFVSGHLVTYAEASGGGCLLADGGVPGATAFSAITGATNTTAAMIVGAGATLGWTSTGTINAKGLGASLACANCGGSAEALTITSQAAADVPLKIVGAASQSGKLLEVTNSTPVDLDYIDSAGSWFVGPSNSSQIETSPTILAWVFNGTTRGTIACASGSGGDCDIISNSSNGNIILSPGGNGLIQLVGPSISKGTKFTISGCSAGSTLGGSDTGSFLSGTTGACTVVVTISGATGATATNGWVCHANDLTTPANLISQSAYSTTTCTITGTTNSGDLISFSARAF